MGLDPRPPHGTMSPNVLTSISLKEKKGIFWPRKCTGNSNISMFRVWKIIFTVNSLLTLDLAQTQLVLSPLLWMFWTTALLWSVTSGWCVRENQTGLQHYCSSLKRGMLPLKYSPFDAGVGHFTVSTTRCVEWNNVQMLWESRKMAPWPGTR